MSNNKINITFILPTLHSGGAERVVSFIAKEIDKKKFNSTLVIVGLEKEASFDVSGIKVIYLEKSRVLNGVFAIFKYLKKNNQDIVLSAIEHLNTVVAYLSVFFPKTKFIAREVNVLSVLHNLDKKRNINPSSILYNNRFKFFDAVICQSQDMLEDLKKNYNIRNNKLVVINNPITDGFYIKPKQTIDKTIQLITVGRLAKQKGYDRILKALSQLTIPFQYTIIGSGPQKEDVLQWITDFNLNEKVTIIDFTSVVPEYLTKSDLYIQGSYVEGFPNALIESCAVGTPVVAFKALGGIEEIIEEGINGYCAENIDEFISYIEQIYKNSVFEPQIVSDSVYKRFHKNIILKNYEELFLKLVQE